MKTTVSYTDTLHKVPKKVHTKRQFFFYTIIIVLIAVYGLLAIAVSRNQQNVIDLQITRSIQRIHTPIFQMLMLALTFIGNSTNAFIITIVTASLFVYKKRFKEGVILLISTLGTTIISVSSKLLVQRSRPDPNVIHQMGKFLKHDSFPSGHVLFYLGFFGFLLYFVYTFPKENKLRSLLLIVLTLMILLIGSSRIYLGAHWFSDTLGSYLIGSAWLLIVTSLYTRWVKKAYNHH